MSFFSFPLERAVKISGVLVLTLLLFSSISYGADTEPSFSPAATDCSLVTEIPHAECQELMDFYDATDGDNWNNNDGWKQTSTPCSWYGVSCSGGHVNRLVLQNNGLNGSIPDFTNLPNLQTLDLIINQLSGGVPDFSNLSNLQYLILYQNELNGSIPDFSNLPNLRYLILGRNQLSGGIPDFANLPNLENLSLYTNQLDGSIPDFTNLLNLDELSLGSNQLFGNIPDFTNLPKLEVLSLSSNLLDGSIPTFTNLSKLQAIYLSSNQLDGDVPSFINQPNLWDINLSSNQLSGGIPDFSSHSNLLRLNLSSNQLSGSIPEFANLSELESLNLSSNQLSGNVPASLCSLSLNQLNVDYNKLDLINTDSCVDILAPNWKNTQTVPPTNILASALSGSEVQLSWDTIPYTDDSGYYEVLGSTTEGGPYTSYGATSSKTDDTMMAICLTPATTYYFVIRTFTPVHDDQQNNLFSENSEEVSVLTGNTNASCDVIFLPRLLYLSTNSNQQ